MATPFAVFSATDGSFIFYNRDTIPVVGDIFEGKLVSNIYVGFDTAAWPSSHMVIWSEIILNIISVSFSPEFATVKLCSTSCWFCNASNMTSFDGTNINTSHVDNMRRMFSGCSSLKTLDLSNFDTSNVTDMHHMFSGCSLLSHLNIGNFDTSNVTDMSYMFSNCKRLEHLDISNFDTSNVVYMQYMFYFCSFLDFLDLRNFDTSNVTNMRYMFGVCSFLDFLDFSSFDTSNVTDMRSMFSGCTALKTLDLSNFDTSNVTDMYIMFSGCTALKTVYVSHLWSTISVDDGGSMFYNCTSIVGAVPYEAGKTELSMANYETGYLTYKRYIIPENMLIKNTTLYELADKIRVLNGTTDAMTLVDVNTSLDTEKSNIDAALAALAEKGVEVPEGSNSGALAGLIEGISTGFPNGTEWTKSHSITYVQSIVYGDDKWIYASGSSQTINTARYSYDGKTWTQINLPNIGILNNVAYGNGLWIMCSTSGILCSSDGIEWELIYSLNARKAFYLNDIWVVLTSNYGIYYSTDGMTWTQSNVTSGSFYSAYEKNGIYTASSESSKGLYYSTDGKTWTQSNITSGDVRSVYNAKGIWVACGYGTGLYYSADGMTWTQSNVASGNFSSVTYAKGIWVANSFGTGLYYSADGMTWTQSNVASCNGLNLKYANGIWVAGINDMGLYYSTDGMTWTQSNITSGYLATFEYANGIWVGYTSTSGILYSVAWES